MPVDGVGRTGAKEEAALKKQEKQTDTIQFVVLVFVSVSARVFLHYNSVHYESVCLSSEMLLMRWGSVRSIVQQKQIQFDLWSTIDGTWSIGDFCSAHSHFQFQFENFEISNFLKFYKILQFLNFEVILYLFLLCFVVFLYIFDECLSVKKEEKQKENNKTEFQFGEFSLQNASETSF